MNRADLNDELLSCLSLFTRDPGQTSFFDDDLLALAMKVQAECRQLGASILYPSHSFYPTSLLSLPKPPPFLSCIGDITCLQRPVLAVVGGREPTIYAESWMERHLTEFLRSEAVTIVSGGARGIDQKAHFLCLRMGVPTAVVLPTGLANPYPDEVGQWKDRVLRGGGVILSAYPPWQTIRRSHFEARNLLIAALGKLVFVVEARRRSGSLITARQANNLSKTICVLPSSPGNPHAMGTLDLLIQCGASGIRDAADLKAVFR